MIIATTGGALSLLLVLFTSMIDWCKRQAIDAVKKENGKNEIRRGVVARKVSAITWRNM